MNTSLKKKCKIISIQKNVIESSCKLLVVDTLLGSVKREGTETAVVNQEAEVTLTTSQQLIRPNVEVVGELKSLFMMDQ